MRPGRGRFSLAPRRQLTEALPGLREDRGLAACPLVAADNHIDVKRVELESAADAAGLVGRDEGRARAKERVDDDVAAVGEIEKGVLAYMLKLRDRVVLETPRVSDDVRRKLVATNEIVVIRHHSRGSEARQSSRVNSVREPASGA